MQEVIRIRRVQRRLGTRKLYHMMSGFFSEHKIEIGRDRFFDLLREEHLLIRKRRRNRPRTTVSCWWRRYPNLVRGVVPSASGEVWVSDITYVRIGEGFGYLSLVTDAYSRKIMGHHLGRDLSAGGCCLALKAALRDGGGPLIHHSDRGVQYSSAEYRKLLGKRPRISMTEKGDPLENAIAERVNGILKQELLDERFSSFAEARKMIDEAVRIYNYLRPHLSIDMLTPSEAHRRTGELRRRWKSCYRSKAAAAGKENGTPGGTDVNLSQEQTQGVNLCQE